MVALSDPLLVQLAWRLASRDVSALALLQSGASSLTYMGRCADRPVVVKVARPGVRPIAHRDVLRQPAPSGRSLRRRYLSRKCCSTTWVIHPTCRRYS
jgi:hypothetical protein